MIRPAHDDKGNNARKSAEHGYSMLNEVQEAFMKSGCRFFLICLLLLVSFGAACKKSSSKDGEEGVSSWVTIGPEGGIVAITEQESDLYGAQVSIPRNALEAGQGISLTSTGLPRALPNGQRAAGRCISFSPDGTAFKQPVRLYLPYSDVNNDGIVDGKAVNESKIGVLYHNEKTGRWEELELSGRDERANLAIVETTHFSTYLVFINTSDSQTLDTSVPTNTTDGTAPLFTTGDCLVGNGNLFGGNMDSCYYYNLTVTRRPTGIFAVIDRHATFVQTGIPAIISPEGDSVTFDAASAFSKVLASGSASQWNWVCEYVREHTYLKDYEVRNDASIPALGADPSAGGTYAQIQAVDANMVRISWPFDINEQILYMSSADGLGHRLVIRLRATYQ